MIDGCLTLTWAYCGAIHAEPFIAGLAADTLEVLRVMAESVEASPEGMTANRDADIFGVSPLQAGMLFHSLLEPSGGEYVVVAAQRISGRFDPACFRRAWDTVVAHTPVLRAAFRWSDTPCQVVAPEVVVPWREEDWRGRAATDVNDELRDFVAAERLTGFDLGQAPLMRFALLRVGEDDWHFVWTCHHLLLDGWSRPLVLADVTLAYDQLRRGVAPQLPARRPYRDYITWLEGRDQEASRRFWTAELTGVDEPTLMVPALAAVTATEGASQRYDSRRQALSAAITERVRAALRREQITLGTAIHAAWALLLARHTRRSDVVFGTTVAGRPSELDGVEAMIGPFINTIPARVIIEWNAPVAAWLRTVQHRLLACREFEWTALVVARACAPVPAGTSLFDSLVVVENYPGLSKDPGGAASPEWTNYPLTLSVIPGDCLALEITHATAIDPGQVDGLLGQLASFLEGLAEEPDRAVAAVPLQREADERRQLVEWNRTDRPRPRRGLPALVADRARLAPEATALECRGRSLSYGEVSGRIDALAAQIHRREVGRGARVGLLLERGAELPIAMLAVHRAGAAFVPLDPAAPVERLRWLLADADVELVLTTARQRRSLEWWPSGIALLDVDLDAAWAGHDSAGLPPRGSLDDPAYMVYTSGTSGQPKGVVVAARSLAHHARAVIAAYELSPGDRVLHSASPAFDVAIEETLPALAAGATVVVWPEPGLPSPVELDRFIDAERVTVANLPTPYWHEWVDDLDRSARDVPQSLRLVVVGTDAASPEALARWRARVLDRVAWVNAYGCTEATITSTVYRDAPDVDWPASRRPVPIGRPLANTRVYVVDETLRPVPIGVPGELVVAGDGVALGYWRRPEDTAARFVRDPWRGGDGRAYRTGDLARWRQDGNLELLGRLDRQIKLRGFRVEPAEIEAAIASAAAVGQVAVVPAVCSGDTRLVAYVVSAQPLAIEPLRARLRECLPALMVPSAIVQVDHLPRTANGKLDVSRLPPPPLPDAGGDAAVPPRNELEQLVAAAWAQVLGLETVGVHANFFYHGGHSLTATRLVSQLGMVLGRDVPLRLVFDHPTVAEFAVALDAPGAAPPVPGIGRRGEPGPCPLSFAQERLWFLDQLAPGAPLYNLPCSLRLRGVVDLAALTASLAAVVARHDALRTTFVLVDGRPVQVVAPSLTVPLRLIDLSDIAASDRDAEARRRAAEETQRPFDLVTGPLVRAAVLRMEARDHVLTVTMHHIVSDGWSVSLLLDEVQAAYDACARGRRPRLPPLPIQYGDYARWQRRQLTGDRWQAARAYWRAQLAGAPAALDLPTDRPRPPRRRFRGACDAMTIDSAASAAVRGLAEREGVTFFMVVLAAWQLLLGRWSGQDDVSVGVPVAGRQQRETERLIGFFLNNLVLRTRLDDDPSFRQLLARVRAVALDAFEHQDVPFETVLADLAPVRDPSRTPLFQVYLNVLNFAEERLDLPEVVAETFSLAGGRASGAAPASTDGPDEPHGPPDIWSQFDLTLYAGDRGGRLRFVLVYDTDLFDRARMAEMLDQLAAVLTDAAAHPERPLSAFSLLTPRMASVAPDPAARLDDAWHGSVGALVAARAAEAPERVAVESQDGVVTYGELDRRTTRLARILRASGAAREEVVAVYGARSSGMVWALIGILKSGAAFTVLDPRYPPPRLLAQLESCRPRVLLRLAAAGRLPEPLSGWAARSGITCIDESIAGGLAADALADDVETSAPVEIGPDDAACIGFTSGSTGVPKGIVGRHGPLTHFLPWMATRFGLRADDRFSLLAGLAHDPLQREIFTPLCLGASVVIPPPETYADPVLLAAWLARSQVSVTHLTPALGQLLLQGAGTAGSPASLPDLRLAFFVGDRLRASDVAQLIRLAPALTTVNFYGTTETQRAVGYHVVEPAVASGAERAGHTIPLGRGIADVQLLVLNAAGRQCGLGELGEIHVRSPHLARGYLGDEALTAERFLANPAIHLAGDRLYRTGDLGRLLPDGEVTFAGRADTQVKIRGFRVELSEVEAVLASHPAVADVVVVSREDGDDHRRLVAYVVETSGASPDHGELGAWVADRLPTYMVPAQIVRLAALPVTPNGKLDVRALPMPGPPARPPAAGPQTATEAGVSELWRSLPGVEVVSMHAGFFESGGHSLLSMSLLSRVSARYGVDIPVAAFLRAPTIAALAAAVDRAVAAPARVHQPFGRVPRAAHRARVGPDGALILTESLRRRVVPPVGATPP